jgi:putative AlgH/UPF0301 family transcriptional regulator
MELKAGTILVANKLLDDYPDFKQSVMLILKHDEDGTIAVNLAGDLMMDGLVNVGGPFQRPPVLYIHPTNPDSDAPALPLGDSGYSIKPLTADEEGLEVLDKRPEKTMLVMGHMEWEAGELEESVKLGAWGETKMPLAQVLDTDGEVRWKYALKQATFETPEIPANPAPQQSAKPPKPPKP